MDDPRDVDQDALAAISRAFTTLLPAATPEAVATLAEAARDADPAAFRAFAEGAPHLLTPLLKAGRDSVIGARLWRRFEGVAAPTQAPQPPANATPLQLMQWARAHGLA